MNLNDWADANFLKIEEIAEGVYLIDENLYLLKKPNAKGVLVDKDFCFLFSREENSLLIEYQISRILFEFGGRWYWSKFNSDDYFGGEKKIKIKAILNDLKFIGKANIKRYFKFTHLGVHSQYEILNGSGDPEEWVSKANFFGMTSLGMCDKNTLAGTLPFQIACDKKGVKPILGATLDVIYETVSDIDIDYEVKLYVKNATGWRSLLKLFKVRNIDNDEKIYLKDFLKYTDGLILVLGRNSFLGSVEEKGLSWVYTHLKNHKKKFNEIYAQVDSVEFLAKDSDDKHLLYLKRYFNEMSHLIPPVLINDSYYVEQEYYKIKEYLNAVKRKVDVQSDDQYFKHINEVVNNFLGFFGSSSFKNGESPEEVFKTMITNTNVIAKRCDFRIDTSTYKLPNFEYNKGNIEEYFIDLIMEGLKKKVRKKDWPKYLKRIEKECDLIMDAGFTDYFLILWDLIEYCKREGIEYGVARGSVGGCLVAYLLDIIKIDPIEWDLLFERFLNETRARPMIYYDIEINGEVLSFLKGFEINGKKIEDYKEGENIDLSNIDLTEYRKK